MSPSGHSRRQRGRRATRAGITARALGPLFVAAGIALGTPAASGAAEPASGAGASVAQQLSLPAIGTALAPRVAVRHRPRPAARVRAVMTSFRPDYRQTVFFVIGRRTVRSVEWLKVHVPGRPNGRRGWVRSSSIRLSRSAGPFRIVIDRSRRQLTLHRKRKAVLRTPVAVGKPGAPTPLGRFYVTAAFRPADRFYGPWAFETSAYAAITDWPGGGIVGVHGTSEPWSVGHRASSGCIRLYNKAIRILKQRVRPGTPIRIRA